MSLVDFVGREIKPGDTVVYPVRRGSGMWLTKVKVSKITEFALHGFNETGRPIRLRNLKNLIVVQGDK